MRRIACVAALTAVLAGCGSAVPTSGDVEGGNPRLGAELIASIGCGACHRVPGVDGADGRVAPPLDDFGARPFIAGELEHTPENLVRWIMEPQAVDPGSGMPDLGVDEQAARHMAAYLRTLGTDSG